MNNGFVRHTSSVRLSGTLLPLLMHVGIPAFSGSLMAIANALHEQKLGDLVVSASPIR
ncbi:hypothetical protein [Lysobacter sp. CA196]|uniref:hypothetical protein n=1 Tax=Lysobacter sp. CA196 TaxID=3455606 RepID=UPI003F8D797B